MTRRGFSLMELLVAIGVIAVLIAISVPVALSTFKEQGESAVSLARLREHVAMFYMYAGDNDDYVPAPIAAGPDPAVIGDLWWAREHEYFHLSIFWSLVLAGQYYDGHHSAKLFSPLELEKGYERYGMNPLQSDFQMSCAFLAGPEFFSPETRRSGLSQLGARRLTEVVYPSDKTLLAAQYWSPWEPVPLNLADKQEVVLVGWTDGSAEQDPEGNGRVMRSGDGADAARLAGGHEHSFVFGTHTLDGVRGTDR